MLLPFQHFSSFRTIFPHNRCEPAIGSELAQGKRVLVFQYPAIFKLKGVEMAGNGGTSSGDRGCLVCHGEWLECGWMGR